MTALTPDMPPVSGGHRTMSRRQLFGVLGGGAGVIALGYAGVSLSHPSGSGTLTRSQLPLPAPFQRPLPVPPVLTPTRNPEFGDADYYEITQRVGVQEIVPGIPTQVWGYNGIFPGPTIVSRSGRRTVVRHTNALPVPTVAHLHGGHTPADSDGFPTDLVLPRNGQMSGHMGGMPGMSDSGMADPLARISHGSRVYDYPMRQRAATLWYHDHRMDFTGLSVYRGLAGFHIIHDDEEDALPLPRGERDIPLLIADRSFAADGSFRYPALNPSGMGRAGVTDAAMNGVYGDVILVNGAPWPVLEVAACRYRFRVLNGSNARRYRLALDPSPAGGAGLVQIGSDGGLLERPVRHDSIDIASAERFDVVVDFSRYSRGQEITLVNQFGAEGTANVMRFRVTGSARDDSVIPERLSIVEPLDPRQAQTTRSFLFQRGGTNWKINGQPFNPIKPLVQSGLGATEIWRFVSDFHHPIHVHLNQFQVLSRNGEKPGPFDGGWKDTVDLHPAEELSVVIRLTDYPGRYVMHCHNLEHEDMAMMAAIKLA